MDAWLPLIAGATLLYLGAEWFVSGASALALALRIPQLLIGLTVVAYGTSAPEIVVGVEAAADGHGGVALGNVIGSNIANIGLILGISVLIRPAKVDASLRRRELPMLLAAALLVPVVLWDGAVATWESAGLLVLAAGYTARMVREARTRSQQREAVRDLRQAEQAAETAGAPGPHGKGRAAVVALVGLALLLLGGQRFVVGAVALAQSLGLSERTIGLTVVAVGTSLPELVTSAIAARRGQSDLAVGNVVGSNIFNVLLCLGVAGLAGPVRGELATYAPDLLVLLLFTAAAAAMIRRHRVIARWEGAIVLVAYIGVVVLALASPT